MGYNHIAQLIISTETSSQTTETHIKELYNSEYINKFLLEEFTHQEISFNILKYKMGNSGISWEMAFTIFKTLICVSPGARENGGRWRSSCSGKGVSHFLL